MHGRSATSARRARANPNGVATVEGSNRRRNGMGLRVGEVVIDCAEHGAVVDFWEAALGYERQEVNEQYVALAPKEREIGRVPILFQKVPEPKRVKNRVHLDFRSEDMAAEVDR